MGKIIAFSNQKGGVGKTTTCVNLTANLAKKGFKCLIVDIDPQGNTTTGLGFSKVDIETSLYDVIIDFMPAESAIVKTDFENLDLLPSSIDLAGGEVELAKRKEREKVLKKVLEPLRDKYDYITIDCPPSLGLLTVNVLTAADEVLVPIQSEYYALEGLSQLMNTIKIIRSQLNANLKINGVLVTMNDSRALISRQITAEIRSLFPKAVYQTVIPRNIRLAEAPSHGKPISLYDRSCKGAKAYADFTEEFLERENK